MVGKRIQILRIQREMSLSELADRAGVAKSYLSTIERDIQSNPSVQFLQKVSAVLNVPVESLISDETNNQTELDNEWIYLVNEAIKSGVSKAQFREWLAFQKWRKNH